jgi:hypothetical protein
VWLVKECSAEQVLGTYIGLDLRNYCRTLRFEDKWGETSTPEHGLCKCTFLGLCLHDTPEHDKRLQTICVLQKRCFYVI